MYDKQKVSKKPTAITSKAVNSKDKESGRTSAMSVLSKAANKYRSTKPTASQSFIDNVAEAKHIQDEAIKNSTKVADGTQLKSFLSKFTKSSKYLPFEHIYNLAWIIGGMCKNSTVQPKQGMYMKVVKVNYKALFNK